MRKPTDILPRARELPHFEAFLATRKTAKTRESYGYALGHWSWFLSEHPAPMENWRDPFRLWLADSGYSELSAPYHLSAVSQYLKYLEGIEK